MAIVFPHQFHDGVKEGASGVQVMDNLNALKAAAEALEGQLNGLKVRVGESIFTWGSAHNGAVVVAHGLGKLPLFVSAAPIAGASIFAFAWFGGCSSRDSTNMTLDFLFQDFAEPSFSAATGVTKFLWLAVG